MYNCYLYIWKTHLIIDRENGIIEQWISENIKSVDEIVKKKINKQQVITDSLFFKNGKSIKYSNLMKRELF